MHGAHHFQETHHILFFLHHHCCIILIYLSWSSRQIQDIYVREESLCGDVIMFFLQKHRHIHHHNIPMIVRKVFVELLGHVAYQYCGGASVQMFT